MQVEFGISGATRYWITIFWFGLGAVILGVFAALSYWIRKCRKKPLKKKTNQNGGLRRSSSAIEFDASALTAANRRQMFSRNRSASSEQDNISDQSEHSEKSPLVSARLDNLAKLFFSKSMPSDTGSRDTIESVLTTRPNLKYQYSALDSGNGVIERSPRERAARDRALNACQEWVQNSNSRYEVIIHLDEIGSRHAKNWFLISDSSVRTDRLMSLLPLPPDCVALEELPPCESPKVILLELLGSLHHPYIYPVLDLGFLRTGSINYACLVTPFNSRGSLKDLIYKAQWNEPWNRKYTRKPYGLPTTQVQRLGRQILEALMFLKERGFPLHGHLHSGNVILQNGAARLSGLENGLLGLSSRVNAIMWSRSTTEIENIDIICFGHLLYEMCTGLELTTPKPSMNILEMDLERYPQILEILRLIFDPPGGVCPTVEELVLTDLFRSIDLRELRGPCISAMKPSLSRSTLNLLSAVKKRQTASLGNSLSETNSPCTPPSTPRDRRSARTVNSFNNISSDSEEGLLDEVIVATNRQHYHNHRLYNRQLQSNQHHHQYDPLNSPIHFCDSSIHSDDNSSQRQRQQQQSSVAVMVGGGGFVAVRSSSTSTMSTVGRTSVSMDGSCSSVGSTPTTIICQEGGDIDDEDDDGTDNGESSLSPVSLSPQQQQQHEHEQYTQQQQHQQQQVKVNSNSVPVSFATCSSSSPSSLSSSSAATNHSHPGASFNHQLTADICSYKNSKSRRLEYSLKCLKYGRSNPSQDSAFGSLTDGDLSIGSSSFRLSSFQSISSPIDEGVEDIIIATTSAGNETSLELATMPTSSIVSNDSAISTPCRDGSPNNFFTMDEPVPTLPAPSSMSSILPVTPATVATSVGAVTQTSSCIRPQQFPVSLSPKIFVTTTSNSSSSSISSATNLQFDPPKILVNDQNSIYTTSPSKRSGTIEVFSQKYRVCSFEDMSPSKRTQISSSNSSGKNHLKNVNRMAFRSLEEERRIDSAFMPIQDRTNSDNRVNINSEKYKKLTHSSFRISKTTSQMAVHEVANSSGGGSGSGGCTSSPASTTSIAGIGMCTIDGKKSNSSTSVSRQTMWRDSKFYRKNRIAKSNDSLLESSPNHSARLSPSSLRDNHYDSGHHSRQSLNRGCSANEISAAATNAGLNFGLCGLVVNQNFAGTSGRRYCSSKSEELCERNDSLRAIDSRMSYSERQLFTMSSKLKQTAITLTTTNISDQCFFSEDESFNDDNNQNQHQYQQQHHQQQHHQQQHHQQQVHQNQKNHQQTTSTPHQLQHRQHNEHSNSICSHSLKHRQQQKQKLSFSTCSINSMSKTKTKTTSLATLPPYQNNLVGGGNGSSCSIISSSVQSVSEQRSSCNSIFKSLDDSLNFIDSRPVSDGDNDDDADADDGDNNSSADESPSRNIASISGIELSRIFNNDNALTHNSSCSEEKTPLLDSVELSPMSPIDTELNQM